MGKKTTHLKRAAKLMARYANKGAIFTNQQRDLILSFFLAMFIAIVPLASIYDHRTTEHEHEEIEKAKAEMRAIIEAELAQKNDTVSIGK